MCSLCNLKKRNKITKKCLRGWKSSNIWEIALLSLVLPGRKDKKTRGFFFFLVAGRSSVYVGCLFCVVSNDLTLVIIGPRKEEGHTRTTQKKNGKVSEGGVGERKREKLSDINYIGCERYITPDHIPLVAENTIVNSHVFVKGGPKRCNTWDEVTYP